MKRVTLLLSLSVAFIFLLNGCDKFTEKTFSTTIEVRFPVTASSETSGEMEIDLTELADILAANPDLAEHKDKIKSYKLVGIRYKVFEYWNSPTTTFNGSIGFGNKEMTAPGPQYGLQNISLQASMDQADLSVMNLDQNAISQIQQFISDSDALKIFLKGTVSENPVDFKLYMQLDIDAVAEVKK